MRKISVRTVLGDTAILVLALFLVVAIADTFGVAGLLVGGALSAYLGYVRPRYETVRTYNLYRTVENPEAPGGWAEEIMDTVEWAPSMGSWHDFEQATLRANGIVSDMPGWLVFTGDRRRQRKPRPVIVDVRATDG